MLPAMNNTPIEVETASGTLLDNPIWHALRTEHAALAEGGELARRYPAYIGPLSGIPQGSAECYEALRPLAGPEGVVVLFSVDPPTPTAGWELVRGGQLHQMIADGQLTRARTEVAAGIHVRKLHADDAPEMVALAELTEPGPFRLRTLELGTFFGIFEDERLLAMAGKRMHLPGMVEVSGVCTHPDARGRGFARLLMSLVMDEVERDGKTPFLHVMVGNPALRVYEDLGFKIRQTFYLEVLKNKL